MTIYIVEKSREDIAKYGYFLRGKNDPYITVAYIMDRDYEAKKCWIAMPLQRITSKARWDRLLAHEIRHCHGETHFGPRFPDEEPFPE